MAKKKKLSNPSSTGGAGNHFEAHVIAKYVTLMLTKGYAPSLPCWPIVEIKPQTKKNGYHTDDFIVYVENPQNEERRRMLVQVKRSISLTANSDLFEQVIHDAWEDFMNPRLFEQNRDSIALITGPLSATDQHNMQWLLEQARCTKDATEFMFVANLANFSPPKSVEKLTAIQAHLKTANKGVVVSPELLHSFLKHFYLLGYDLGSEVGVILSLLHSHMSQFQMKYPQHTWARIVEIAQTWNQNAGTITLDNLPEDLLETFKPCNTIEMPEKYSKYHGTNIGVWNNHPDAYYIALLILIGGWDENNSKDCDVIFQLLGIPFEEWLNKARKLLHDSNSLLRLKDGIWHIENRVDLLQVVGSHIYDQILYKIKGIALDILREPNQTLELLNSKDDALISSKVTSTFSVALRTGLSEGLAILSNNSNYCPNCSVGKIDEVCSSIIYGIFLEANWVLWGSLNNLLPTLAEVSPVQFLESIENGLRNTPNPFAELFLREGKGLLSTNYLTGLFSALEGLAWYEQYLVRVCVILGELACHDPGGQWINRPINSLTSILIPWSPQTLASPQKRRVAVQSVTREVPEVGWDLVLSLLPRKSQVSSMTNKPVWNKIVADDWKNEISYEEYWEEVSYYSELAITAAGTDTHRLAALIDFIPNMPSSSLDRLIQILSSNGISDLPEEKRIDIWNHLNKTTIIHKKFEGADWALSAEVITKLDNVAKHLAPKNLFNLFLYLFDQNEHILYEKDDHWEEQIRKLNLLREKAVFEIYENYHLSGVIQFAESVFLHDQVGYALGSIDNSDIDHTLLPSFLENLSNKLRPMIRGYIWKKYLVKGWNWCDNIDKSNWLPIEKASFLSCLPFVEKTWERAFKWLGGDEKEYWIRCNANPYQADGNPNYVIKKLIEFGRANAAIEILQMMLHNNISINPELCTQALLEAASSRSMDNTMYQINIIELIKFLQENPSTHQDCLIAVEWAYLQLFQRNRGAYPKTLENMLASDPQFFSKIIQISFRSTNKDWKLDNSSEEIMVKAIDGWTLLQHWKTIPGIQPNKTFSGDEFKKWLQFVEINCKQSGHWDVAMNVIGKLLIHTPSDPSGFWIHLVVANALDNRDVEKMRDGYRIALYNSRGLHGVDPTGGAEKELADYFRKRGENSENEGFHRIATMLRKLASDYETESKKVIDRYN